MVHIPHYRLFPCIQFYTYSTNIVPLCHMVYSVLCHSICVLTRVLSLTLDGRSSSFTELVYYELKEKLWMKTQHNLINFSKFLWHGKLNTQNCRQTFHPSDSIPSQSQNSITNINGYYVVPCLYAGILHFQIVIVQ